MKIIKNEIRPIGFLTLELNESEINTLIGVFDEICYIKNRPSEDMLGTRGNIYKSLLEALETKV